MDEWEVINSYIARPPVQIRNLIEALGIKYVEAPMNLDQSGYFARRNGGFEIGINAYDSTGRKRFTAAHELGHFILHRDLIREGQHFDRLFGAAARENPAWPFTRAHEVQANRFAADILMPASHAARRYQATNSIAEVAAYFGVSEKAAEIRLKNLGLIE